MHDIIFINNSLMHAYHANYLFFNSLSTFNG